MILRQIVDLALDPPEIAPQPKETDDQKERSTVLCQQHYNHKVHSRYMGAVWIVSLTESCEKSRANRIATLAHPRVRNAGPLCYSRGGFTGRDGR